MTTKGMVKLDWLSFTFPLTFEGKQDYELTLPYVLQDWRMHTANRLSGCVEQGVWEHLRPVGFYQHRCRHDASGIVVQWSPGNSFALCEISGRSVDFLLQSVDVSTLAQASSGRATRLDVAVDFETDLSPQAYVSAGYSERIKSVSSVDTETGSTRYVGARSGERMARVYRYSAPHPRSHLLRVEVETKGDFAKIIARQLCETSLTSIVGAINHSFAWKSPLWKEAAFEDSRLPARFYDHEGAETLRWLNTVVAPALVKSHQNGLIDLDEWIRENLGDQYDK